MRFLEYFINQMCKVTILIALATSKYKNKIIVLVLSYKSLITISFFIQLLNMIITIVYEIFYYLIVLVIKGLAFYYFLLYTSN